MPFPLFTASFGRKILGLGSGLLLSTIGLSCRPASSPQADLARARETFIHGDLASSRKLAQAGYERYRSSSTAMAWKFRLLEAESLLWSGMFDESLQLLNSPELPKDPAIQVSALSIQAVAHAHLHQFGAADRELETADAICRTSENPECGTIFRAHGILAIERGRLEDARQNFESSLTFGRKYKDQFLEATALLNLGDTLLNEERFSEAADVSEAAYRASEAVGAKDLVQTSRGNLGWAYYRLGDSERALNLFTEAEQAAAQAGDIVTRISWLTNIGYVQMDAGHYQDAEHSYNDALRQAREINARQDIFNGLRALAKVSVQAGQLDQASRCADEAIQIAQQSGNRAGELYPLLVKGQIAALSGNAPLAEKSLREVQNDPKASAALIWGSQHALAQLHEKLGDKNAADREYRAALTTFEKARSALEKEDAQLPFVTNASRIYADYIDFLIAQGKTRDALEVADYSRARTLAEGLGLLRKGSSFAPEKIDAQAIARRSGGTIFFYWLAPKRSYLWTIDAKNIRLAQLPPAAEINANVQRYRKALLGPIDVLEAQEASGLALYNTLVAPVRDSLPPNSAVHVIPDGSLNSLNFETILVPDPKPHYWIEDVTVVNASSLKMLASAKPPAKLPQQKLLLLGDPATADPSYPTLSNAAAEIDGVRKTFPPATQKVLAREQATPVAYLNSDPSQFDFIHFVAHGTASRLSPLDSAVVLSRASAEQDSFKLFARDIVKTPLRAELVTISTCYGAGSRAYTGEGLVGLSWAFLRAGAHNVIGALWEVSDVSTPGLMEHMYSGLNKGQSPATALREAKLGLLRPGSPYRSPFYWAPFQLYTGS
jgi:CHAT domain-containing protein/Tfp pilus assembly protein PilF